MSTCSGTAGGGRGSGSSQRRRCSRIFRMTTSILTDERSAHLDGDLCYLIVESGVLRESDDEALKEWQRDDFEWNGKTY